jgi:hypothetical protein
MSDAAVHMGCAWGPYGGGARGVGVGSRQSGEKSVLLTSTIRKTSDADKMGPARRYRP